MRQVVLELPDDVLERANAEARRSHRSTESLLADALVGRLRRSEADLPDISEASKMDLSEMPDPMLEALIRTPLSADFDARLSELGALNSAGELTGDQRGEFERMLRVVHSSTMLKALALAAWRRRHGSLPSKIEADW
jgi:hypothetical protein